MVPVGDQRGPFGVDVELHRADRTGALEDPGQRGYRLVVGGRIDEVAATVDTDAGAPDADSVPEREAPLRAVVQAGLSRPPWMISGRLWRANATVGPGFAPPVQVLISMRPSR